VNPCFVYDARIRNNGTAVRCWDAVKRGIGFPQLKRYEPHGILPKHELYIYVDDGRDDIEWECPRPNAYWAIDTHLGYDYRLRKAQQFDYVFTAQKEGAVQMRKDGIKRVEWLPLACHPPCDPNGVEMAVHPFKDRLCGGSGLEKQYDLCFVGFMNEGVPGDEQSHNRVSFLDAVFRAFPSFWCSVNFFFEEAAIRYIRARLGLNISIKHDMPMRFFEGMSYGTAMLNNEDQEGWRELGFEDGKHFIAYKDDKDILKKIKYYLSHIDERESIAREGHRLVREKHTYVHRMKHLLDVCNVNWRNGNGRVS
jgi:O-antigen biosynthesis protein